MSASFVYEALDGRGARASGRLRAASEPDARRQLAALGLHPLRLGLDAAGANAPNSAATTAAAAGTALSPRALEALVRQLAKMVQAGLPLERALTIAAGSGDARSGAGIAAAVLKRLREGRSPSAAFAEDPLNFDATFVALVQAGEVSGKLGEAFGEIERITTAANRLRSRLSSALIYPAILGLVALGSIYVILGHVIPSFRPLLPPDASALPLAARLAFGLAGMLEGVWLPVASGGLLGVLLALRRWRGPQGARRAQRLASRLPVLAPIMRDAQLSRLCRVLGTLLVRNVLLVQALDIAGRVLVDPALAAGLTQVRSALATGKSLSAAMREAALAPSSVLQLVAVGEETGDLGAMLLRAADLLEEDLDRRLARLLTLLEPGILAVVGLCIGGLLYGLFSAILAINNVVL
jgi:general secretion pathway protein F